jgi:predicted Zn-dependent protease
MSAQAGYDPRAGITLWEKMMMASGGGSPPKILSTHPASADRVRDIEGRLPRVLPMFDAASKPRERFGPPPRPKD